ncbi:MAG: protein-L-isoaspartate O-methyltransferase [Pseudomonadota bacterium]|nr:protein-L-isoaspartate O-methyltransferase [Pseudomonadota bacterium]
MTVSTAETIPAGANPDAARRAMIDSQLRVSGVNDAAVLAAIGKVAREQFVPAEARGHAYIDRAIPLGEGRALPAPLVHGLMLSEALPRKGERVLVVTAGSTYLAALVEAMGALVDSVDAAAVTKAKRGAQPYDLVLIDGAIEQLPDALADALAENGRVVTGLVLRGVTRLASGRKLGGNVQLLPLAEVGIPVLGEFVRAKSWSF